MRKHLKNQDETIKTIYALTAFAIAALLFKIIINAGY